MIPKHSINGTHLFPILNILKQFFYLCIEILISNYVFDIFWAFIECHAKLNKQCRDALYFMTSFYAEHFWTFSRKIPLKSLSINLVKFYGYLKYFCDIISVHFLLQKVRFLFVFQRSFLTSLPNVIWGCAGYTCTIK